MAPIFSRFKSFSAKNGTEKIFAQLRYYKYTKYKLSFSLHFSTSTNNTNMKPNKISKYIKSQHFRVFSFSCILLSWRSQIKKKKNNFSCILYLCGGIMLQLISLCSVLPVIYTELSYGNSFDCCTIKKALSFLISNCLLLAKENSCNFPLYLLSDIVMQSG